MANEAGSTAAVFSLLKPGGEIGEQTTRPVVIEAPVAIEFNGIGYAVMMATPINLDDFAIGFCLAENLITRADEIISIDIFQAAAGHILRIALPQDRLGKVIARARQRVSESSCGLCGMDNLDEVMRPLPLVTAKLMVADSAIFSALLGLRAHQPLNAATGAAHAAAFCAPDGSVQMIREDVGRHNALDKLIGALAKAQIDPAAGFILLTARCSFELVQKAVLANCPLLVTISAATDLAIVTAAQYGLRLISLARADTALDAAPQTG